MCSLRKQWRATHSARNGAGLSGPWFVSKVIRVLIVRHDPAKSNYWYLRTRKETATYDYRERCRTATDDYRRGLELQLMTTGRGRSARWRLLADGGVRG